jgi:hypothetical protein
VREECACFWRHVWLAIEEGNAKVGLTSASVNSTSPSFTNCITDKQ